MVSIHRKPWVDPKTPCSRRKPIHAEYLARHYVIHIHLTDLKSFGLLLCTTRGLGTDNCPDGPQLTHDLLNHDVRRFTAPFGLWLISQSGTTRNPLLMTIQQLFHLLLGSEARGCPQLYHVYIFIASGRLTGREVLKSVNSWLSGGSNQLSLVDSPRPARPALAQHHPRHIRFAACLNVSEWFSGARPVPATTQPLQLCVKQYFHNSTFV